MWKATSYLFSLGVVGSAIAGIHWLVLPLAMCGGLCWLNHQEEAVDAELVDWDWSAESEEEAEAILVDEID